MTGPRLKPLQQWICDECGGLIEEPGHGYLEWLNPDRDDAHGFRIVHHAPQSPASPDGDCYRYTHARGRCDGSLDSFVGPYRLPSLLRFLDIGPYHQETYEGPRVRDIREWVEVFRRLQLPYYEEARLYWPPRGGGWLLRRRQRGVGVPA